MYYLMLQCPPPTLLSTLYSTVVLFGLFVFGSKTFSMKEAVVGLCSGVHSIPHMDR